MYLFDGSPFIGSKFNDILGFTNYKHFKRRQTSTNYNSGTVGETRSQIKLLI